MDNPIPRHQRVFITEEDIAHVRALLAHMLADAPESSIPARGTLRIHFSIPADKAPEGAFILGMDIDEPNPLWQTTSPLK